MGDSSEVVLLFNYANVCLSSFLRSKSSRRGFSKTIGQIDDELYQILVSFFLSFHLLNLFFFLTNFFLKIGSQNLLNIMIHEYQIIIYLHVRLENQKHILTWSISTISPRNLTKLEVGSPWSDHFGISPALQYTFWSLIFFFFIPFIYPRKNVN